MTANSRTFLGVLPRVWAMLLLACAASAIGSGVAIHYSNASQDRQQEAYRRDQERRQDAARRALEAKFQQALAISNRQNAYSINKSVCVLRPIALQTIARLERTKPDGYQQAEAFWQRIADGQVPVPPDFDCATLPKKPPKPQP